ncbi:MAG TPA: hypothetical protein VFE41_22855 [Acetobacteraceae bacterium]|nr:hypothetical protein [Acetobacteraceae bacterium]
MSAVHDGNGGLRGKVTTRPMRSNADQATAIDRIEALRQVRPSKPARDELQVCGVLVAAHEDACKPILPPGRAVRLDHEPLAFHDLGAHTSTTLSGT